MSLVEERTKNVQPRPRRRRRLDPSKHARIIESATDLFLKQGLQSTSMDLVAQRAGVSKMTVYSHFASKKALFNAIIEDLAQQLTRAIERLKLEDMPPEEALRLVGRQYLRLALAPSSLALHRLVVAEAARIPGFGPLIFESGPATVAEALGSYLTRQPGLRIRDGRRSAEQFLGAVLGHAQLRLLLKAGAPAELRATIDETVDHAVEIFCHGILSASAAAPCRV